MPSPAALAHDDATLPVAAPRKRKGWRLATILLVIVGLAFATSACTPEMTAKAAIEDEWGAKLAPCAERIAKRESNFDASAVNRSSGTTGLFQLHPMHATWIKQTFGYDFSEMKDARKNAEVARGLSNAAWKYYGDGWQPWRLSGKAVPGGGCPA